MTARLAYVQHRLSFKQHQRWLMTGVSFVPSLIAGTGAKISLRGRDNPEAVKTWRQVLSSTKSGR
jgi:hypothetical protein